MLDHSHAARARINLTDAIIPGLCAKCQARHIGLCDALSDGDLNFLASVARPQTVTKGQSFVIEGDPARHFFNINHGVAKLYKDMQDGRRQITGFVSAGDFVGLAADESYAFSAEAIQEVQLCRFERGDLRSAFGRFPEIERRMLDFASHELIIAQEQMLLLGRKTAIERLASFLHRWVSRAERNDTHKPGMGLPMTRADLADYLGLTIETVSRALSSLRKQGVISVAADHEVTIVQAVRLAEIAEAGL